MRGRPDFALPEDGERAHGDERERPEPALALGLVDDCHREPEEQREGRDVRPHDGERQADGRRHAEGAGEQDEGPDAHGRVGHAHARGHPERRPRAELRPGEDVLLVALELHVRGP